MKKLSTVIAVFGCMLGLVACNTAKNYSDEKLDGKTDKIDGYVVAGAFGSNVDKKAVEWNYTAQGVMTISSVKDVSKASGAVADKLAAKGKKLVGLYMYEGARFGCSQEGHADWGAGNPKAIVKGKVETLLGSYCVKAIGYTADDLTGKYLSSQWVPNAHDACVENLSPKTLFMPSWTEADDKNGFNWTCNPVVIGGAGVYTVVLAVYDETVDETNPAKYNYGMAVIKTKAEKEYTPAVFDHYRLVGSINSWNKDDTAAALQFNKTTRTLSYTFALNDEFKVISALTDDTGTWAGDMGFAAATLSGNAAGKFADNGGNIKCTTAGTYTLVVNEAGNGVTIS